jgi:16S rRNA G1207 methylase RsmC
MAKGKKSDTKTEERDVLAELDLLHMQMQNIMEQLAMETKDKPVDKDVATEDDSSDDEDAILKKGPRSRVKNAVNMVNSDSDSDSGAKKPKKGAKKGGKKSTKKAADSESEASDAPEAKPKKGGKGKKGGKK